MKANFKAYLALIFICIVWGTTYLAVRIAVKDFPPFLFMALRQCAAGLLLLLGLFVFGKAGKLDWSVLKKQIVPGLCMITFGNGIVAWSVQYIPSGIAALICSMIPLYVILINLLTDRQEGINRNMLLGTALGFGGIILIFRNNLQALSNSAYIYGILVTVFSCICWAAGTVYTRKEAVKTPPLLGAALQLLIGGLGILVMSFLFERGVQVPPLSSDVIFAWVYLVLLGSIAAFAAYLYALSQLPVGMVTVYAYVNPLVAVIVGFLVLHEPLTVYTFLAALTILCGVYLVNLGHRQAQVR